MRKVLNWITNRVACWHSDNIYKVSQIMGLILYSLQVPSKSSDTLYFDMADAYDALLVAMRDEGRRFEGVTIEQFSKSFSCQFSNHKPH